MPTTRLTAEKPSRILISIYPSAHQRDIGGWAIRLADGCFLNGDPIRVDSSSGIAMEFRPANFPLTITEALDDEPTGQVDIAIQWPLFDRTPAQYVDDFRMNRGVAEVAIVHLDADGTGLVETWSSRIRIFDAAVRGFSHGGPQEPVSIQIVPFEMVDEGTLYPTGAELTSDKFGDIADTSERGRAQYCSGRLPPYPITGDRADYDLWSPAMIVGDEDDAIYGSMTALVGRKYLLVGAGEALFDTSNTRYMQLVNPTERAGGFVGGSSAAYSGVPAVALDLLGQSYTYVVGAFAETFISANVTTTAVSPTVTGRAFSRLVASDQFRVAVDQNYDLVKIDSIDGLQMTLVSNYRTANTNQDGQVIRLPVKQAYAAFLRANTKGGIQGPWGQGAMYHPAEVLEWFMRKVSFSNGITVNLQSIRALEQYMVGWSVAHVVAPEKNADAWSYVKEHILSWLPVRWYLFRGVLNFIWDGPVHESDVQAEVNLDERTHGFWRTGMISDLDQPIINEVELSYGWDLRTERWTKKLTGTALLTPGGSVTRVLPSRRALDSQFQRPDAYGQVPVVSATAIEIDAIQDDVTASLAIGAMIYRFARTPMVMESVANRSWEWIRPGCIIRAVACDETPGAQRWRVRSITREAGGDEIRFRLESIPDTGLRVEYWGDCEGTQWGEGIWP